MNLPPALRKLAGRGVTFSRALLKDGNLLSRPQPEAVLAPVSYRSSRRRRQRKRLLLKVPNALQETVTFTDKKKIAYNYSDPGGTLEKFNKLKPFISCNEKLYISKEVKEKMLLLQRANHADHKQ